MKKLSHQEWLDKNIIVCECGYNNKKIFVDKSGICIRCKAILDDRAYFKSKLGGMLRIWKGKKWR